MEIYIYNIQRYSISFQNGKFIVGSISNQLNRLSGFYEYVEVSIVIKNRFKRTKRFRKPFSRIKYCFLKWFSKLMPTELA